MPKYEVTRCLYRAHAAVIEAADPEEALRRARRAWDDRQNFEWLIEPWESEDTGEPAVSMSVWDNDGRQVLPVPSPGPVQVVRVRVGEPV